MGGNLNRSPPFPYITLAWYTILLTAGKYVGSLQENAGRSNIITSWGKG